MGVMTRKRAALAIGAGVGVGMALRATGRRTARRAVRELGRRTRYAGGRMRGMRYRLGGGRPDPGVPDDVLADRIRSALGPLATRLDLPKVHVMVEDHIAVLHGDVATAEQADRIAAEVEAVSGVAAVRSRLHVGLIRSDTRPSAGRRTEAPSAALHDLLRAAVDAGLAAADALPAVAAIVGAFLRRLPAGERQHVLDHLPHDVRAVLAGPLSGPAGGRVHTVADFVARVGTTEHAARNVLGVLHDLVPEEAGDVAAVLPAGLRPLWATAPAI